MTDDLITIKRSLLIDYISDFVWASYNAGIERDGRWQDGALSTAEYLGRQLNLSDGWSNAKEVKSMLPGLIDRLMEEAIAGAKEIDPP